MIIKNKISVNLYNTYKKVKKLSKDTSITTSELIRFSILVLDALLDLSPNALRLLNNQLKMLPKIAKAERFMVGQNGTQYEDSESTRVTKDMAQAFVHNLFYDFLNKNGGAIEEVSETLRKDMKIDAIEDTLFDVDTLKSIEIVRAANVLEKEEQALNKRRDAVTDKRKLKAYDKQQRVINAEKERVRIREAYYALHGGYDKLERVKRIIDRGQGFYNYETNNRKDRGGNQSVIIPVFIDIIDADTGADNLKDYMDSLTVRITPAIELHRDNCDIYNRMMANQEYNFGIKGTELKMDNSRNIRKIVDMLGVPYTADGLCLTAKVQPLRPRIILQHLLNNVGVRLDGGFYTKKVFTSPYNILCKLDGLSKFYAQTKLAEDAETKILEVLLRDKQYLELIHRIGTNKTYTFGVQEIVRRAVRLSTRSILDNQLKVDDNLMQYARFIHSKR
ncbi:hypothetical protein ACQKMK_15400 [Viridibacillus arvi]|uniref:hypothetical protein n=1 Tax=Viridibacillus arvi TaxID=263475 RepID=UPI003CFE32BD